SIPDSSITYTWKVNDRVQGSLSGLGRSSLVIGAPPLFGSDTVEVDAHSNDGSAYGSATLSIPAVDPQPTLYLDDPLNGIEYYNALGAQASVGQLEATFAAVPYFVAARSPDDRSLTYAWSVNGQPVPSSTSSASELTVNAAGSSGIASLSLTI